MLKQHLAQGSLLRVGGAKQFREKSAFFSRLVKVITKSSQKPEQALGVVVLQWFVPFNTFCHLLQYIERAQHKLVILKECFGTFHEMLLPRFLKASINPGSLQNC